MVEALKADPTAARLQEWRRDVEVVRIEALELMQLHDEAHSPMAQQQFARLWANLAGRAFDVLWSAFIPELIAATAEASLDAGFPVFGRPAELAPPEPPVVHRPSWKQRQRLKAEAEAKEAAAAAAITVIEEPEPLPEPEPVAQEDEVEELAPEPVLPVVLTAAEWEAPPEQPAPAPPAAAPPAAPEPDGWVVCSRLAELLNCSTSAVSADRRDGVFDGCWREPLPGEGKGVRYDVEACRAARDNKPDRRRSRPRRPNMRSLTAEKLAADPELQQQLEQLLAAVRAES